MHSLHAGYARTECRCARLISLSNEGLWSWLKFVWKYTRWTAGYSKLSSVRPRTCSLAQFSESEGISILREET